MPSDVKCGLLVAIAGLLVVALVCFRKTESEPVEWSPSAEWVGNQSQEPKEPTSAKLVSRKKPN